MRVVRWQMLRRFPVSCLARCLSPLCYLILLRRQAPKIQSVCFQQGVCAGEYTAKVAKIAEENQDFVMGFISITPSAWPAQSSPGLFRICLAVYVFR